MTADEVVGRHHQLNGHEFERALRDSEAQGSLAGFSPQDSQVSSPAPQFESFNSLALSLLYGPTLTSIHDY